MNIGFVGLGKMGLPIAVAMALKGHDVIGHDLVACCMTKEPRPYQETGPNGVEDFNDQLASSALRFGTAKQVVAHGDIVFVTVQTPHDPRYEGVTRLPDDRVDFNYDYLVRATQDIVDAAESPVVMAIMSTVLPGTVRRLLLPIVDKNPNVRLVYNPSFIAMGTTMHDFLRPEFVLVGVEDVEAASMLRLFYKTVCDANVISMTIESAELAKVAYNTYVSLKIAFANTVMEVCDGFEQADCDDVMGALKRATKRLVSSTYMDGGMGDGGGCHPRDNIAMSWLAREQGLSFDLFEAAMLCREKQAEWLADMLLNEQTRTSLPIFILGTAFKAEVNLIIGSSAYLVGNMIQARGSIATYVDDTVGTAVREKDVATTRGIFLVGCKHARYENFVFADGSVVIDPHRYVRVSESSNYTVRHLGEGPKTAKLRS